MALLSRPTAFVAALALTMLASLGVARAQLASPGDLSKPHAFLDGMSSCTKCHPAGKQLSAATCLDCHVELRARVDARKGLHGRMSETDRTTCQTCHTEHEGRDAKIVVWKPSKERFDHGKTGWPLRGKHVGPKCADCHNPRTISDPAIQALLRKHPSADTYLGVSEKCTTCHFDEHRGQLGQKACDSCHGEAGFKPAPKFDHGKSDYPLTGKHKQVACEKCHDTKKDAATHPAFPAPRSASFAGYTGLSHGRCSDCHDDPHDGRFGKRCESCHSTEAWTSIKKTADERGFHEKTRYPLRGLHAQVPCVACHGPFPGKPARFKNMSFGKCMDCHRDAHAGQASVPACERCHSVEGFAPARFELEEHKKTPFPLEGAHAAAPCVGCHPNDLKLVEKLRGVAATSSKSSGKHKGKQKARRGPAEQAFAAVVLRPTGKPERCETCHADPHAGQFKELAAGCAGCHQVESFTKLRFDHDKQSRFPLTGKHASATCGACHKAVATRGAAAPVVRYKPLELACASCHADVHLGQFAPDACDKCHTTVSFPKTSFDHGDKRYTSYALDGKHRQVECARCHTTVSVAGRAVRRYRPLPRACEGCHADFHKGDFKGFEP